MITSGLLVFDEYYCDCQLLMLGLAENFEWKEKLFISTVQNKVYFQPVHVIGPISSNQKLYL